MAVPSAPAPRAAELYKSFPEGPVFRTMVRQFETANDEQGLNKAATLTGAFALTLPAYGEEMGRGILNAPRDYSEHAGDADAALHRGEAGAGLAAAGMALLDLSILAPTGSETKALGPAINITAKGLAHTLERHVGYDIPQWVGKSKFASAAGMSVTDLADMGTHQIGSWNGNRFVRVFDAGMEVGFDATTKQSTSTVTIVTERNGNLVTMHPGRPK